MLLKLSSLLLLSLTVHLSSQVCLTVSKQSVQTRRPPKVDTPCVFPFYHKGKRFEGCKEYKPSPGNYWCSTKVSQNGTHIKGEFGFCGDQCDRACADHRTCLSKNQCPLYQRLLEIRHDRENQEEFADIRSQLRRSICNKPLKRICCANTKRPEDTSTATHTTTTATILTKTANTKTIDGRIFFRGNLRLLFPNSCDKNPGEGFSGEALPHKGQCGVTCNRLGTIIGGKNAELGEFPWAAMLGYKVIKQVLIEEINEYKLEVAIGWKCGGTLINSWYVLTAAHCVQGKNGKLKAGLVKVKLGELTVGSNPDCPNRRSRRGCMPSVQDIDVGKVIVHNEYSNELRKGDKGLFFDIALIRLKTEATLNRAVQFACLPFPDSADIIGTSNFEKDLDGRNATVIGWGKIANYAAGDYALYTVSEKDLQKLKVPIVSHKDCSKLFSEKGYLITEKHLCAGGVKGEDSCHGDSGGGLFIQANISAADIRPFVQIGLVSFGSNPCGVGTPGVYTRVQQFIQWIMQQLEP